MKTRRKKKGNTITEHTDPFNVLNKDTPDKFRHVSVHQDVWVRPHNHEVFHFRILPSKSNDKTLIKLYKTLFGALFAHFQASNHASLYVLIYLTIF